MFNIFIIFISIAIMVSLVAAMLIKGRASKKKGSLIFGKNPLTRNEQPMYFRLVEAFPEHVVLTQVAFSALMKTSEQATRSRFDRKVADFVLCSRAFEVIAVIELDDSNHEKRKKENTARDKLMIEAGYRVLRYKRVPNINTLQKHIGIPESVAAAA